MKKKLFRPQQIYVIFLLLFFAVSAMLLIASATLGNSPDLIVSDGNGYYAWVRSIFIDGDLDFANDFELLYFPEASPFGSQITPKGLVPNKYPIGVAILEIPGFLIGHLIANLTSFETDGLSLPYHLSVALSLVGLIVFSFYLLFLALKNYTVKDNIAIFFCGTALLGTNLLHYIAKEPTMAHGAGLALANIAILFASQKLEKERLTPLSLLSFGLMLGLLILVRNTNIFLLPFLLVLISLSLQEVREWFWLTFGIGIMLFLQQLSLFLLWGEPILYSYGNEGFQANLRGFLNVTFGASYGVFVYHPWYLILLVLNIAGLFWLKFDRNLLLSILFGFFALTLINGLWDRVGDSFGNRMFIEMLAPLSFGAAIAVSKIRQFSQNIDLVWVLPCAAIAIASNFYLWAGYLLRQYPHNSDRTLLAVYQWLLN